MSVSRWVAQGSKSPRAEIGRGLLKIVTDQTTPRILGVHAVGEGSAELIHVGQMALITRASVDDLIENVFNFPTLTEVYRIAALDCANRIDAWEQDAKDESIDVESNHVKEVEVTHVR